MDLSWWLRSEGVLVHYAKASSKNSRRLRFVQLSPDLADVIFQHTGNLQRLNAHGWGSTKIVLAHEGLCGMWRDVGRDPVRGWLVIRRAVLLTSCASP